MNTKRKLKQKILSFFLMAAVTVTMVPAGFAVTSSDVSAATTMKFTSTWDVKCSKDKTVRFNGVSGTASAGYFGLCAKAGYQHYSEQKKYNITDVRNHDFGKLAYYYGYIKGWKTGENGCKLARAFNYVNNKDGGSYAGKAYVFSADTLKKMRNNAREYCASHPIPSNFHGEFTGNNDTQLYIMLSFFLLAFFLGIETFEKMPVISSTIMAVALVGIVIDFGMVV